MQPSLHLSDTLAETAAVMPLSLAVLGNLELVESIISYFNFFDFAGKLALSCSVTWHTLNLPLHNHAHSISQYMKYLAHGNRWEEEVILRGMDMQRAYFWNTDDSGCWHEIASDTPSFDDTTE